MTPEERLDRIEVITEKQNAGIRDLIVVSRTVLNSIDRLSETQKKDREDWNAGMKDLRDAQAATDEKLKILIDTVDRIIRRQDNKH